MQRAVAATASSVAAEMIEPPAFDPRFLAEVASKAGKHWDTMNAEERAKFAMQADDNYKKCCSVAAMENLMCIVQQVRQLDLPEYNKKGTTPGREALQQMLMSADERTRPVLELAIDHAEAAVQLDTTRDPVKRQLAEQKLKGYRQRLQQLTGAPAAGEAVVEQLDRMRRDSSVRAVVVRLDSPGGGVAASQEIYEAVMGDKPFQPLRESPLPGQGFKPPTRSQRSIRFAAGKAQEAAARRYAGSVRTPEVAMRALLRYFAIAAETRNDSLSIGTALLSKQWELSL